MVAGAVIETVPQREETLGEFLASRARRASDSLLAGHAITAVLAAVAIAAWRGPLWDVRLALATCFLAFGIWGIVWLVQTKNEMKTVGAEIPTAWLLLIPFVNLYWFWLYSGGVAHVSNEKMSQVISFILLALLGVIGLAIIQDMFNKLSTQGAAGPSLEPSATT